MNPSSPQREYVSVKEWALLNGVSERTARNYCVSGKIPEAFMTGKTWNIPQDAVIAKRGRKFKVSPLLERLRNEKEGKIKGGIYHRVQVDMTYNSNHMEGSRLTIQQTRNIFETRTLGVDDNPVNVDDLIETVNHFRAIDYIIENTYEPLTERYIKHLHQLLKSGTSYETKESYPVGKYKKYPNEVGGQDTTLPEKVASEIKQLIKSYNSLKNTTFEDIIDFHYRFEKIHPFQDGNGRIGRLIMFRECLRLGYVPFIIYDEVKMFYYRGLQQWPTVREYLLDTCFSSQDEFKQLLHKFRIPY